MKVLVLPVVVLMTAGVLALTPSGEASTGVDLSMTGGGVAAGIRGVQSGQQVPFVFTMKNNSRTSSANISFVFSWTGATVQSPHSYLCPLVSNRLDIGPDGNFCETGNLGPGASAQAGLIVTVSPSVPVVTVTACASDATSIPPDPVPANNCRTVAVPVS